MRRPVGPGYIAAAGFDPAIHTEARFAETGRVKTDRASYWITGSSQQMTIEFLLTR